MDFSDPFFSKNFLGIKSGTVVYVTALLLAHGLLDGAFTWPIAVFFSIAMNFTYPWSAWRNGQFLSTEVAMSAVLIGMSLLALMSSPLFVVAAIFLHGIWDLAKHKGCGTAFFGWYVSACVIVDTLYAAALFAYWLN